MLTPRDLQAAVFRRALWGYRSDEVDGFLRRVIREYEALYQEREAMQQRIGELEKRLAVYGGAEERIEETLRLAREVADGTRRAAEREAEALIRQARARAAELVAAARQRVQMDAARLEAMGQEEERFRQRLRHLLEQHLELLDAQEHASQAIADLVASWSEAAERIEAAAETAAAEDGSPPAGEGAGAGTSPAPISGP